MFNSSLDMEMEDVIKWLKNQAEIWDSWNPHWKKQADMARRTVEVIRQLDLIRGA